MAMRKDEILVEYARKLKELEYLWSDPLRPFSTSADLQDKNTSTNTTYADYIDNADIESKQPLVSHDIDRLKRDLAALAVKYLRDNNVLSQNKKRQAKDDADTARKAQKISLGDNPHRSVPVNTRLQDKKTVSNNLQSQLETLEAETNEFLNKKLSDLDVVALPEHLPTQVHNVLSLAELYYLTQTLPLIKLLPGTHKTLMTENFESAILEGKVAVLFSRIEELKRSKKWSLRQPIRYYDPFVYAKRNMKSKLCSWDYILKEGKWMATDFKESSKFKKLCCVTIAQAVQNFWSYGRVVCISRKPIVHLPEVSKGTDSEAYASAVEVMDTETSGVEAEAETVPAQTENVVETESFSPDREDTDAIQGHSVLTAQENVLSMQAQAPEPETIDISKLLERPNPADEIAPFNLPQYSPQDLLNSGINIKNRGPFKAHVNLSDMKKLDQSIIRNLPKFTAFDDDRKNPEKPIPTGETTIVPVSQMLLPMEDDDEWHKIVLRDAKPKPKSSAPKNGVPEYQKGLFGVQSHRRLNFLRPPKPPAIKNIEFRSPTIWLPQDDKYLIHYVAEYCFNWDLISENLQQNAATLRRYESNIERRTPWQCFERYVQLNEKFQFSDMKGINAYSAQQWLESAHKAQSTTKRRISPLGVGNESIQRGHRRLRWASMFDAMRKTMRKRENALAKSTSRKGTNSPDISSSSSVSTANGSVKRASDKIPTPLELSTLKHDRDKSMQEAFVHQQATRSKMMAAVGSQKGVIDSHPSSSPGFGGPTDMTGISPHPRVSQAHRGAAASSSGPNLQRPQAARPSSQQGLNSQQQVTQQQQNKPGMAGFKRPTTPNGTPLSVEQIQRLLQIQKQRRMIQQQQQQSGSAGHSPGTVPASPNPLTRKPGTGQIGGQVLSGNGLMPGNSLSAGNAAKKGPAPVRGRIQFPPAQVSAIINSIQQKNPNLTKDQVTKLAASYLANLQQQQQNKLEQPHRAVSAGESSSVQQNLQARQAQLSRQRLAASTGLTGKETDAQTLSKMQYEERKKLMMQQGGSQYAQGATNSGKSTSSRASSKGPRSQGSQSSQGES
ncbi:hypothetical protein OXX69_006393 [Metschnikowia pulcherrima]